MVKLFSFSPTETAAAVESALVRLYVYDRKALEADRWIADLNIVCFRKKKKRSLSSSCSFDVLFAVRTGLGCCFACCCFVREGVEPTCQK